MESFFSGYIKNNQPNLAIDLFNTIEHPNEILVNLVFNACAQLKTGEALNLLKNICSDMPKMFYSNPYILSSLLDALMKCGDVKQAQSIFNSATKKVLQVYGAMMNGKNHSINKQVILFLVYTRFVPDWSHSQLVSFSFSSHSELVPNHLSIKSLCFIEKELSIIKKRQDYNKATIMFIFSFLD